MANAYRDAWPRMHGVDRSSGWWRSLAVVLAMTFLVSSSNAVGAVSQERPIAVTMGDRDCLVSVRLDEGVYRELGSQLRAIRVLDSANRETPFLVRPVVGSKTRTSERTALVERSKAMVGDGDSLRVEFTIDAKAHPAPVESFTVDSELSNFEQRVDVDWSSDGMNWSRVVESALLYDYTQYLDARETKINLPQGAIKEAGGHFRLTFRRPMQLQESPLVELTRRLEGDKEIGRKETLLLNRQIFRIERIRFAYQQKRHEAGEAETEEVPVRMEANRIDPKTGEQEIVLSCGGQPIRQLEFVTEDANFGRLVRVDELTGKKNDDGTDGVRSHVTQGRITRFRLEGLQRDEVKIPLPGERVRLLRIQIENRNSPPLVITRIIARAGVAELLFVARPGERYRLRYGGAITEAPAYDTLALDAAVVQSIAAARGSLGVSSTVTTPDPVPVVMREPLRLASWWFLLLVVTLVVAVGYGLFQAVRRVETLPGPDA